MKAPKESRNAALTDKSGILKPTVWFFHFALLLIFAHSTHGAGVTIITHGLQPTEGTPAWLNGMGAASEAGIPRQRQNDFYRAVQR